ncbi:hypothetical protein ACW4UO_32280, partial [Klebsiella pneumoniae]
LTMTLGRLTGDAIVRRLGAKRVIVIGGLLATAGMLLATLAVSLMAMLPDQAFLSWGWRVPFILSAGLVFLGLWIRNGLDETPDFKQAKESGNV